MTIFPVRYDFSLSAYIIVKRARISVDLGGAVELPEERLQSAPFMAMLSEIAFNGNALPTPLAGDPGEYLVICPDNCWSAVGDFAAHKESRGHKVVSVRLSSLGVPASVSAIKNFIKTQYDTLNPAPTFVVLVGDIEMDDGTVVPQHGYTFYNSDHSYSLTDGDDFFSDVFLGRISVENLSEFRVTIEKIKRFENSPTASGADWMQRAMVVSTYDHAVTPVWNVLWIRELLMAHGFTQVDTFFERGSSIPPASDISAKINAGLSYIDYRGWAGSDGWWEPAYTRYDVLALTNSTYPVVTSIVCGTGDFGSTFTDPCFGEAWIRAGSVTNPRGGVGFFGTSDHASHTRYNNPINSGFYIALFDLDLPHFGQCVWVGESECLRLHPFELTQVEQYFMTYEILGDPGLMMYHGGTPELVVNHGAVGLGASVEVEVTSDGAAYPGALVCLYRAGTGEKTLAYTDFTGNAELIVPGGGSGTVRLTVVSPFHITYTEDFTLSGAPNFAIASVSFDDASGDGDGRIDPGESGRLEIELRNNGPLATHVETYLWCEHEGVSVEANFDSLWRVWGGEVRTVAFDISASGLASGGGPARMNLLCDTRDGSILLPFALELETSSFYLDSIIFDDLASGDGDGLLEPGETASARLVVRHSGSVDPSPLEFAVYSSSGWVDVLAESVVVSAIAGGVGQSAPFTISASADAFEGMPIILHVFRRTALDEVKFGEYSLNLGLATSSDPTGPDGWGYFAYDNTDITSGHAPTSSFEDISTTGTAYPIGDDETFEIALPFDFVFYGRHYDTLTVCSNGWAAPGKQPYFMLDFYNTPIPGPNGPWGTLAPFWDDLQPIVGPGGVFYQYFPAQGKYIVQWQNMEHAGITGMDNTFQLAIFDPAVNPSRTGDSPIEFRYSGGIEDVDNEEEYSTVGIESPDHVFGLEYQFGLRSDPGAAFLTDGRVIRFTTDCGAALIEGFVRLERGHPQGARITSAGGHLTEPDISGYYRFTEIEPGVNVFTCSAPGHFAQVETVTVVSDELVAIDFYLPQAPIPTITYASKADSAGNIAVIWTSAGMPSGYRLYKYLSPGSSPEVFETTDTVFLDSDVSVGRKFWYRVSAVFSTCESFLSDPDSGWIELLTGIDEVEKPEMIELSVSPNPFNSSLRIRSDLPGNKEVAIFDMLGRRINTIPMAAGESVAFWDGKGTAIAEVPSGIYFIELRSETRRILKRAVLIK